MKKIITLALVLFLTYSCSDDETTVFEKNATERAAENKKEFNSILNSSNWIIELFPNDKQSYGGFGIFADFSDQGKVSLANEFSYTNINNSTYDVKSREGSVLSFNEFNSGIHVFAKPSFRYPKGFLGTTDYEFIYIKKEANVIYTKGVKTGNEIRFVSTKDTPEEYFTKIQAVKTILADKTKSLFLQKPTGLNYKISFSGSGVDGGPNRVLLFEEIGGEKIKAPFTYRTDGIRLYKPITVGGITFDYLYLKSNNGKNKFQTKDGKLTLELDTPLINFSTKSFRVNIQNGFASPNFIQLLNTINSNTNDKVSTRLTFSFSRRGTPIVIGRTQSGLYAYERSYTYTKPDTVYLNFPKVFGPYSNANGSSLLTQITSKSAYKITNFNSNYYKLTSLSDDSFWFLIKK